MAAVVLLMMLASLSAYAPRFDYAYPLHADEWTHLAEARQVVNQGALLETDAVTGEQRGALHPEAGYHLLLVELHLLTGIPLLDLARYLPAVFTACMVLGAYAFAERRGFGLEAALCTGFAPTTVRLLGPGFAVPAALGLLFVPLTLLLVERFWEARWMPPVLALVLAMLFVTHPPSAVLMGGTVLAIVGLRLLLGRRPQQLHALGREVAVVGAVGLAGLPFVVLQRGIGDRLNDSDLASASVFDAWSTLLDRLGVVLLFLAALGLLRLALSVRDADHRQLLVTIGLTAGIVLQTRWLIIPEALYSRALLYFSLLALLSSAFALAWLRTWAAGRRWGLGPLSPIRGNLVVMPVIALPLLALQLHERFEEPHYHLVDEQQVADFEWIGGALCEEYETALIDGVLARPFAAVSGRHAYAAVELAVSPTASSRLIESEEVLAEGVPDAKWLRQHGITMVYTERRGPGDGLLAPRDRVWLVPPDDVCHLDDQGNSPDNV